MNIMPYIKQGSDNKCGAFAIAYFLWKENLYTPDNQVQVDTIYAKIQFGHNSYNLAEDYSDPKKMVECLRNDPQVQGKYEISMYVVTKSPLEGLAQAMGIQTSDDRIHNNTENYNNYIIAITGVPGSYFHYVLVYFNNGVLEVYDPASGNDVQNVSHYLKAGIYIKKL